MKSLIQTVAVAVSLAFPIASFAQSNEPMTRAQVQAQLAPFEQAGYNTAGDPTHYAAGIQAADTSAGQQDDASAGYGGVADGASQSDTGIYLLNNVGLKSIYIKH